VRAQALALAVGVVAIAACGGGSERLSGKQLAARAAKICTRQADAIAQIPRGPANALNATGYLGAVLSVVEEGVKQFHGLRPPASEQTNYDAFLAALDRNVDLLRTLRAAAAARQRKTYVVGLAALHRSRLRINRIERRLGFTGCLSLG
jgi:hypothetical protein